MLQKRVVSTSTRLTSAVARRQVHRAARATRIVKSIAVPTRQVAATYNGSQRLSAFAVSGFRAYSTGSVPGQEIRFPALSPTMTSGRLVKWVIKEGDKFKPGDMLFEVETDKATVAFESQEAGVLAKILVPNDTANIQVNDLVALFVDPGQDWKAVQAPAAAPKPAATTPAPAAAPAAPAAQAHAVTAGHGHVQSDKARFPSVKRLLHEYGLDASAVSGSGRGGLLLKGDVLAAVKQRNLKPISHSLPPHSAPAAAAPSAAAAAPVAAKPAAAPTSSGQVTFTDIPTTNMRRVIADRLTQSKTQVPHAYATALCEIDQLMSWRKRLNDSQQETKLSVNDFVIRASALALRDVPEANVSWDIKKEAIVQQQSIDISIAVALESGLITPIIKATNTKGLVAIAKEMKDLAARARANKLQLNEFQGGTFSISNLGMFGISKFSAVINPPQAMILAVGGSQTRVVVDEKTGKLRTSTQMAVTLSYDSRAVDEQVAAKWLAAFEKYISDPTLMML